MSFYNSLSRGKTAEKATRTYLEVIKHATVTDVSNDPEYQSRDIDFVVTNSKGITRTVEVKNDTRIAQTGNIMVELCHERQTGTYQGWFNKCEAEALMYVCGDTIFSFKFPLLKLYMEQYGKHIKFSNGTDGCITHLLIAPLSDIEKEKDVLNAIYDLKELKQYE